MMILVCFSFVLKQTFHGVKEIMIISVLVAFFVGMTWPLAIEQSKTQIAAWIADQKLMLDMAVLLSIDVALTMLFCVHHVDLKTSEHVSRRKWMFFIFLKFFPGLLVFPVLFSVLVMTIFLLPGVSFQVVAWVLAVVLLVLTPVFTYGLRWLLPERPIRLELLFLVEDAVHLRLALAVVHKFLHIGNDDSLLVFWQAIAQGIDVIERQGVHLFTNLRTRLALYKILSEETSKEQQGSEEEENQQNNHRNQHACGNPKQYV
jgi:hypothetical protein